MKTTIFTALTLALLCAVPCLAKKHDVNTSLTASCPVWLNDAGLDITVLDGTVETGQAYASYTNHSAKKITGIKFGLDLMDATNDWSTYTGTLNDGDSLKAGRYRYDTVWNVYPDQVSATRIYVVKVAFDDGTTWSDDGTKACQYVSTRVRKRFK